MIDRRRNRLKICVLILTLGIGAAPAEAENGVRQFPYPFHHSIAFASDVDMQSPARGEAIHHLINVEIGLPVSDSVWAQASVPEAGSSGFLTQTLQVNRAPTGTNGLPAFVQLLREWHRGNIDYFHSWHDDAVYQIRQTFAVPVAIGAPIPVEPTPKQLRSLQVSQLRLVFGADAPSDLLVSGQDADGRAFSAHLGIHDLPRYVGNGGERIVELFFKERPSFPVGAGFQLTDLQTLQLSAASCAGACPAHLIRIERDSYSRS
jgi:hypothetical protein